MPTMPSSGQISSSNLQSVFGKDSTFSSADYYRGGVFVPTSKTVIGSFGPYQYSQASGSEYYWLINTSTSKASILWNGTTIASNLSSSLIEYLHVPGGYRYELGSLQTSAAPFQWYNLRRRTEYEQSINTGVPSSGVLTSSNWYGAENP